MNRRNIINAILILVSVTMLVLLAFRVRPGATADAVAVIRTAGMTCGSCSEKITRALSREKGVAVTEVDVAGGWVVVGYDTKAVKPESLSEKITGAGYGSTIQAVLTPEQFRQITGRDIGKSSSAGGCGGCGPKGGCGTKKQG